MIQAIEKPLNLKQEQFIANYIETGNAFQSAIRAGYAKATAISKSALWVDRGRIKQAIAERKAVIRKKIGITAERQLQRADDVYTQALENKHFTAALTALDQQNRHIGLYNEDNASKADKTLNIVVFGQPAQLPSKAPGSLPDGPTPVIEANTLTDDTGPKEP